MERAIALPPIRLAAALNLEVEWRHPAVRTGAVPFSRPGRERAWVPALGLDPQVVDARIAGSLSALFPLVVRRGDPRTATDRHPPGMETVFSDRAGLRSLAEPGAWAGHSQITTHFVPAVGPTAKAFSIAGAGLLSCRHGRRIPTGIAAATEPQLRDATGSNSVRGASPHSRSRS